jgi:hypothetical protein
LQRGSFPLGLRAQPLQSPVNLISSSWSAIGIQPHELIGVRVVRLGDGPRHHLGLLIARGDGEQRREQREIPRQRQAACVESGIGGAEVVLV